MMFVSTNMPAVDSARPPMRLLVSRVQSTGPGLRAPAAFSGVYYLNAALMMRAVMVSM
jgi:hypothetical protein